MAKELKEFSLKVPFQQYWSLNEFNEQQCFNHDFYRGRFKLNPDKKFKNYRRYHL